MEGVSELETRAINPSLHSISMMFTKKKIPGLNISFIYIIQKRKMIYIFSSSK